MRDRQWAGYSARKVAFAVFAICAGTAIVPLCEAQSGLRFEVASIRLAPDPQAIAASMAGGKAPHVGTKIDGNIVDMGAASLLRLISDAYSIPSPDRVSGPDWLMDQRFDIRAKLPAGATNAQLPELLQSMLAERFGLTFHRTNKMETSLVLLVGPKGPKLEPGIDPEPVSYLSGFGGHSGPSLYGIMRATMTNGVSRVEFYGITMNQFAEYLRSQLVRPVADMTGLSEKYHVVIERSQSDISPYVAPTDALSTWVLGAIDKLGLKLESRKVPVEQFVVDHIEKLPTEN